MNYLAHLLLAENSPESQIGNLLGDFVKGNLDRYKIRYTQGVIKGIKTHRKIDEFTDTHSIYIISKRRISGSNRYFSGIIIDICYDHFLSKYWRIFAEENLENFKDNIYRILEERQNILPASLQQVLPRMIEEDWLGCNTSLSGVALTLARISGRLKRENNLAQGVDELIKNYSEIESDFLSFFPEVMSYAKKIQAESIF